MPRWRTPASLDRDARIIDQYLAQPLLIEGELSEQVQRIRAPKAKAADTPPSEATAKKRKSTEGGAKRKRAPRIPQWIDNALVEDSDEELAFALDASESGPPRTSPVESTNERARLSTPRSHSPASAASTPPPMHSRENSPGMPAPTAPPAARTDSVKRPAPAHRDPLFLFDSDTD